MLCRQLPGQPSAREFAGNQRVIITVSRRPGQGPTGRPRRKPGLAGSAWGLAGACGYAADGHGNRAGSLLPAEHVLKTHAELACNTKRTLERWRVTALFDRNDRLPGNADSIRQLRLRHAPCPFAQRANLVGNWQPPTHLQRPESIQRDATQILGNLGNHQTGEDAVEQQVAILEYQVVTQ